MKVTYIKLIKLFLKLIIYMTYLFHYFSCTSNCIFYSKRIPFVWLSDGVEYWDYQYAALARFRK